VCIDEKMLTMSLAVDSENRIWSPDKMRPKPLASVSNDDVTVINVEYAKELMDVH